MLPHKERKIVPNADTDPLCTTVVIIAITSTAMLAGMSFVTVVSVRTLALVAGSGATICAIVPRVRRASLGRSVDCAIILSSLRMSRFLLIK